MNWTIFEVVLVIDLLLHTNYIATADSKCQALGGGAVPMKRKEVSSCLKKHVGISFSQSSLTRLAVLVADTLRTICTLTNSLPNVIAMYGMTIAMKFKKMPPGVKVAKK